MITLLVPTMNRPDFVVRLLRYYDSLNFKHSILIGDSSNHEEFEKTNHVVDELNGRLNVEHFYYPDLTNYAVSYKLIQKVTTPYSAFLPDDDFLVPNSIEKLISFMEKHPDYSCAWGKTTIFSLKDQGVHGQISAMGPNNEATDYSIENNLAKERLLEHISKYTSVFIGVCRTQMFKIALRNSLKMNETGNKSNNTWWTAQAFGELSTSFSLVAQGKVKSINCLYWVRQSHDQRYLFNDIFDWITSSNWLSCYNLMAQQIVEDVMMEDHLNKEETYEAVKQAFWAYLAASIVNKYSAKYYKTIYSSRHQFREWAKTIPGARQMVRKMLTMRARLFPSKGELSLPDFLSPTSPYHKDFMPVYESITKQPDTKE